MFWCEKVVKLLLILINAGYSQLPSFNKKTYKLHNVFNIMLKKSPSPIQFIIGITFALAGAILMFFGILPLSARITIGIIGLALIATSRFRLIN